MLSPLSRLCQLDGVALESDPLFDCNEMSLDYINELAANYSTMGGIPPDCSLNITNSTFDFFPLTVSHAVTSRAYKEKRACN